jgi:polyisoprenoid-binding protein YceI
MGMPSLSRAVAVVGLFAAAIAARAEEAVPAVFNVREGTLGYTITHKLHQVRGTTHDFEGKVVVAPDGTARVQVRARVASFDSGNSNRDEHMREVTHEAEHPYCSVKGIATGVKLPLDVPQRIVLAGTVELNGQRISVEIPVGLTRNGSRLRASFSFAISLDDLKIERPALLFVRVEDRLMIEGDLLFE